MDLRFAAISRNIVAVEKYFKLYFKAALKQYGFTAAEGLVLYALYGWTDGFEENTGKTPEQLCSILHLDKADMSRTTKSLESKGYLLRENHRTDNRSYVFRPTEKARAFQPVLTEILREWNEDVLSAVDAKTLRLIHTSIENMLIHAQKKVKSKKHLEGPCDR